MISGIRDALLSGNTGLFLRKKSSFLRKMAFTKDGKYEIIQTMLRILELWVFFKNGLGVKDTAEYKATRSVRPT